MALDLIDTSTGQPDVVANELFKAGAPGKIFGNRASTTAALTWGYYGGPWVDDYGAVVQIANGTVSLAASSTNYIEANENGVVTRNTSAFTSGRFPLYTVVTGATGITGTPVDYRAINGWGAVGAAASFGDQGANEVFAGPPSGSDDAPAFRALVRADLPAIKDVIQIACSDETTVITTGNGKVTFRMPFAMTLTEIRASLTTASSSGAVTIDVNDGGTTVFSTGLTIDQSEKTSVTAATPAVISDTALADDAEIRIDIDGAGTNAAGLKVTLIGTRTP